MHEYAIMSVPETDSNSTVLGTEIKSPTLVFDTKFYQNTLQR